MEKLAEVNKSDILMTETYNDIPFNTFASQDFVAFDLDDTIFIQKNRIMRNANSAARNKFIDSIREKSGNERVTFAYEKSPYQLVENCVSQCLKDLRERQIDTMGFTVRRTGIPTQDVKTTVQDDTLRILSELNVQFKSKNLNDTVLEGMNSLNQAYKEHIVDPKLKPFYITHDVMIKDQVIFTNNLDKGLVLGRLFEQSQFFPDTFHFIDDKEQNLISVRDAIAYINKKYDKSIAFRGYHYVHATKLDNTLQPDIIELQKTYMLTDDPIFLTDEEALKMLNQK
jgi:hypothetical protein